MKKILLVLGIMAGLLFSLVARADTYPADPYALIQLAADKTFARLKSDQPQIKSNPDHLRVIIREELLPYIDNRFAAYKVLGNQIKQTTPEQRDAFVSAFTEYMISSYADALAHYDKQTVQVEPAKPLDGKEITAVNLSVKEAGKPDINLEFKLRKNNKTEQWKAFDMVAEGISLLSAKQSELGGLIRQNGIDAVIKQLNEHNAKPLVLKK
ncbi:phospholipid-binding protein MlaC [Aeromonas schubertii]|uniref:Phospholipid-binding protein MlaC n=1 Tax=Aeromonas schubertii TaxID=652 RepID=A0ABS7V7N1_9GAMM|nr:phospholipid-binding protein MlaC [Aeromonas schubertii]MBZ6065387.1 phospholipid-binding protein MlaC [Aeromonas schubertii]QCG49256.1 phospholipid-binding protein MlaC [Aeromonas schubertii]